MKEEVTLSKKERTERASGILGREEQDNGQGSSHVTGSLFTSCERNIVVIRIGRGSMSAQSMKASRNYISIITTERGIIKELLKAERR